MSDTENRPISVITQVLDGVSFESPLSDSLDIICQILESHYAGVTRISIGVYDEKARTLKAFLSNKGLQEPLAHIEAPIEALAKLLNILTDGSKRYIRYLEDEKNSYTATELLNMGYKSSYLAPIYENEKFIGIIALSSQNKDEFENEYSRVQFDALLKFTSFLVIGELYALRSLKSTAKTLKEVAKLRDNETGEHLERMSHYSRLIALKLAGKYKFDDQFIEELYQCAPLHDIGKIGIPDKILLKKGKLSVEEFDVMKGHTIIGKDIIDSALKNLYLEGKHFSAQLINIVVSHHENWDGSGYPFGLCGESIPIEARIVRVADVYDALTSNRPYKTAWTSAQTLDYLKNNIGTLFDADCVEAVISLKEKFALIAYEFKEVTL